MARIFTPIMPTPPVSQPQTIQYVLETLGERIDLHPSYQRDIRWNQEQMCDLVETVMKSGMIPGILLYKLQVGDERQHPSHRAECVDGQHRIFSLSHYFNSRWVELPEKKRFLISLNYKGDDGRMVHIFYKKTDDTLAWVAENSEKRADYMTEDEKEVFNNYLLDIKEIKSPLTLIQRSELFMSLQKGVPVRNSDLHKNRLEIPLIRLINQEMRLEKSMKEAMNSHCIMKAKLYWLNWAIRAYFISRALTEDERVEAFMVKDAKINEMLKKGSSDLDVTPESEEAFKQGMARFLSFINSLEAGVKLTPTQFFVVFTHLLDAEEGREEVIRSHMRGWSTEGIPTKMRKMWEKGYAPEERMEWFERSVEEIERIIVPAAELGERKNIPKKIRDKVWVNTFGDEEEGDCNCCHERISESNWECAHIIAHKCGGKDEESNLVPTCRSCNRSMGTENLELFKARCYPSHC